MNVPPQPSLDANGKPVRPLIQTRAEAESLCNSLSAMMEGMIGILEQESSLVRAGHLEEATDLSGEKNDLAGEFMALMIYARDNAQLIEQLTPVRFRELRNEHQRLKADLQINLAALATAREVSESLLDDVAKAVNGAQKPKTYGASGGMAGQSPLGHGLSINKSM